MKNRKMFASFLEIICIVALCACNSKETPLENGEKYILQEVKENHISQREFYSEEQDTCTLVTEMLGAMNDAIPLKESTLAGEILYLFFTKDYKNMDSITEVLYRASVVKNVTQLPDVSAVYFYVDGRSLTYDNGQMVGLMRPEDFLDNSNDEANQRSMTLLVLYPINKDNKSLEIVKGSMAINRSISYERMVVEQLIQGIDDDHYLEIIPKDTKVLGIFIRDNICYLNLSKEFLEMAEHKDFYLAVYSIVNSLCEMPSVSEVQIQIDGDIKINSVKEFLDKPISRNLDFVGE